MHLRTALKGQFLGIQIQYDEKVKIFGRDGHIMKPLFVEYTDG
jgi:hypothetical protein